MKPLTFGKIFVFLFFSLIIANNGFGQYYSYYGPEISNERHLNSKIRVRMYNQGSVEAAMYEGIGIYDGNNYGGYVELWIGGIIGDDTLVSTSDVPSEYGQYEFYPDYEPAGLIKDISPEDQEENNPYYQPETIFRSEYTDTFQYNDFINYSEYDKRKHKPLRVRVIQTSYSYNSTYADDFVLVEYKIQNINSKPIRETFVGFYMDGSVFKTGRFIVGGDAGDSQGLLEYVTPEFDGLENEYMGAAWIADVNGRPADGVFNANSLRHIMALVPLEVPESATIHNYNWWIVTQGSKWTGITGSWGPRRRGSFEHPLRLFNDQLGVPFTDEERYYMMSFPEKDFSTYYAGTDLRIRGWRDVPDFGADIADGWFGVNYVSSFGPFDLEPGEVKTVTIAYVVGRNFHTNPSAFNLYFNTSNPSTYLKTLDQQNLIDNIRNAKKLFDNPGVDTDGDGDSGKYVMQYDQLYGDSLKVYYAGDGVPDFSSAKPPPSPELRVYPSDNQIVIRWNGRGVEEYFDKFSSVRDFEGYRVYVSRSDKESELVLLSSYDIEDYNRFVWDSPTQSYKLIDVPFTMDSLRSLYGDDFEPLIYTPYQPFIFDGNRYYFTKVDNNLSDYRDKNLIHKVYPDAVRDTNDVDEEGRMRYYEYEYIIDGLLATIPYYVSISTFDFGHPAKELEPMESDPMDNLVMSYAAGDDWQDETEEKGLNAYVYPNPYISDGRYRDDYFENRFTDFIPDRSRAIYFANVPNKCKVTIYSLDGDLIQTIDHDVEEGNGDAHVVKWDVISKNMQTIESGLFYWVIESELGKQIGKLVIIR